MIINPKLDELNFENKKISLDIETTGLKAWIDKIKLISIYDENGYEYIFYPDHYDYEEFRGFIKSLQFCELIINQNIKFDLNFLFYHYDVLLKNIHCTMVTQQIIENGKQSELDFDLVSILQRTLGITHKYAEQKKLMQKSFGDEIIEYALELIPNFKVKQEEYAAEDTRYLITLYYWQMNQVELLDLDVVYKLEHKVMPVIVKMEIGGCKIDKKIWKHQIDTYWAPEQKLIESQLDTEIDRLTKNLKWKYTTNRNRTEVISLSLFDSPTVNLLESDDSLNYSSSDHIISLFHLLGEIPPTNKKGDPSVDEGALTVYLTECGDTKLSKFIEVLLEYRQISKLLSTYGDKFLAQLDENDCIHTQYTQTTTETSRLSSKTPNLQNIPAPDPDYPNKDIRKCFIARKGHKFITCDMAGAEVAIAADLSREPLLVDSLENGVDMHSILASTSYSIIFNKPTVISKSEDKFNINGHDYIPNHLRDKHKSVVFAKFYKGGAARVYGVLSKYINAHHKSKDRKKIAQRISEEFDKKVPKLSKYLSERINEAQSIGYLRAPVFGRLRFFDSKAYGDAANYYLQCLNAEAIKLAMIRVDEYLTKGQYGRILLSVHDELCCEVKEEYAVEASKKIQEIMAQSLTYFLNKIEGKASVKIAKHWKK